MSYGGIKWDSSAIAVPVPEEEDSETSPDPIPWQGASLTEGWEESFSGFLNKRGWRRIEFDLEELYSDDPAGDDEALSSEPNPPTEIDRVVPFRRPEGND